MTPLIINSDFDSGNARIISAVSPHDIQVAIKNDTNVPDYAQWFCFTLTTTKGQDYKIKIINLEQTAYPEAWDGYQACLSTDGETWVRTKTTRDGNHLCMAFKAETSQVTLAYYAAYPYSRHQALIESLKNKSPFTVDVLGKTSQGRPLDLVTVGWGKTKIWLIARQHCGETMAEWFMEGLVESLGQKESKSLLNAATFYLVPNMNPDGTFLGNHRHNATGTDLNREWLEPHPSRSPEVQVVKERMKSTGVDFFLDAHGDETIPYVFLACHPTTPRLSRLQEQFKTSLMAATPDFQDEHGYKALPNTPINFNIAINYVSREFDCLAFTLEMPFKDHDLNSDPCHGWSPQRSKKLARDILASIAKIIPHLR